MKKSQFSPNQIASILKEFDNGKTAEEITREHVVNKETEKNNMETMVTCLASDTTQLENIIKENTKVRGQLDSLVQMRNADLSIEENKRNFLRHCVICFSEDFYFNTNDAALQQLKFLGTLRLIRKQNIIDSIFKYELKNKVLDAQHADSYWLLRNLLPILKRRLDFSFTMTPV